jgi:hypothetical protein
MRCRLRSPARLALLLMALLASGAGGCARVTSACESYCDSWCTLRESCGNGSKSSCLQSCDPGSSEFCAQAYAALPASCDGLIDGGAAHDRGTTDAMADDFTPPDRNEVDADGPGGDVRTDLPPVDMPVSDVLRCQTNSNCDPPEFCRTDHTCGMTCLSDADCTAGGTAHGVCRPNDMRAVALGCILVCQNDGDCPLDASHCTVTSGKCSAP